MLFLLHRIRDRQRPDVQACRLLQGFSIMTNHELGQALSRWGVSEGVFAPG